MAEHLKDNFKIDVLTTCAKDYHTWANFYPAGESGLNGVSVHRFPVDYPRRWYFAHLNRLVHRGVPLPARLEEVWMRAQGPYSTPLLAYIRENRHRYRLFVFFTYLYCTTYYGLPLVKDKAVLVPTAHDEPPLRLKLFRRMFALPRGFIFLTEEEKEVVCRNFPLGGRKFIIAGAGVEVPEKISAELPPKVQGSPYLLYLGRVDPGKNTRELFEYFLRYRKEHPENKLKLVLAGHSSGGVLDSKDIVYLGFVPEELKYALLKSALALVQPSTYESLSLVVLEAMACGTPVLVNARSPVLVAHCRKSGGGLWYGSYEEFTKMTALLKNDIKRAQLGQNAQNYIQTHYSWKKVAPNWEGFLKLHNLNVDSLQNESNFSGE